MKFLPSAMALLLIPEFRKKKIYKQRRQTSPADYRKLYRFDENNVECIANHFLGTDTEHQSIGGGLSNKQQVQVLLRYLSDPGFQVGVSHDMGVHQTTVCKIVRKVMSKVVSMADIWIKFPSTPVEKAKARVKWEANENFKIPNVIGALDCTHLKILKPQLHGDEYINRKGFASINVQATCDATELFTSVDASWPGSVHDSRIWKNSTVFKHMSTQVNSILIGDDGYGIAPWLLTPYKKVTTDAQKKFNKQYAKERVIIERCFGQVKRRFPMIAYKVRVKLHRVANFILCCFIFHNVAKYLNDQDDFEDIPDDPVDPLPESQGDSSCTCTDRQIKERGKLIRDQIAAGL